MPGKTEPKSMTAQSCNYTVQKEIVSSSDRLFKVFSTQLQQRFTKRASCIFSALKGLQLGHIWVHLSGDTKYTKLISQLVSCPSYKHKDQLEFPNEGQKLAS